MAMRYASMNDQPIAEADECFSGEKEHRHHLGRFKVEAVPLSKFEFKETADVAIMFYA
jgi:hypothetical protein